MGFWAEFTGNGILMSAITGWFAAQVLKVILDFFMTKSFHFERLTGSGGMPSSHSATVCALTVSSGIAYGVASFEFAIAFVLAVIVMHDAMGVRRETGKQATLLKILMNKYPLDEEHADFQTKLKEYVGHSPLQVLAGGILGCVIGVIMS